MRNNILIIDDDIDLCTVLARFLSKNGYETDIAHTGYKGIARFTEKKFDVVICDYRLGDMEGKDVVSALKKVNQQVIVLVGSNQFFIIIHFYPINYPGYHCYQRQ